MNNLKTTTELVKQILIDQPATRSNDALLYYRVCDHIDSHITNAAFGYVLLNLKEYGLPTIETVGRCRRKLQHDFPELAANETVECFRAMQEQEFREFARG